MVSILVSILVGILNRYHRWRNMALHRHVCKQEICLHCPELISPEDIMLFIGMFMLLFGYVDRHFSFY